MTRYLGYLDVRDKGWCCRVTPSKHLAGGGRCVECCLVWSTWDICTNQSVGNFQWFTSKNVYIYIISVINIFVNRILDSPAPYFYHNFSLISPYTIFCVHRLSTPKGFRMHAEMPKDCRELVQHLVALGIFELSIQFIMVYLWHVWILLFNQPTSSWNKAVLHFGCEPHSSQKPETRPFGGGDFFSLRAMILTATSRKVTSILHQG